ncbi:MAG: c-type cytochrome [Verrucomicrobia bacterium]|nr:c-type cytochrome [Verrucomicrobiota bacterium]
MLHKALATLLLLSTPLLAQQGNRKGHDNMEAVVPANLVPPAPVLSPEDAMKSFEVAEGFSMLPFATEPMVEKPVALDYDPAGRLWVCEMIGYMLDIDGKDEDKPFGRIIVLEDTDKDGKADKRTVFLEKVLLPRAIAVYPDGILFADQDSLQFIKRDGLKPVGKPTVAVSSYIQGGNVEHRPNGLVRGLDNWLYNAKSSQRIKRDGDKWIVEATPFRGQWGVAFDNYGRIYHNNNSTFLMGEFIAPNLLEGNPGVKIKVTSTERLGSNVPFPIRVTPGLNRAYIQKSNGYGSNTLDPKTYKLLSCTGAAGITVYRGSNFPSDWVGKGLSTEASINLVKAIDISESGTKLKGAHTYKDKEWLASTDERFRPVNIYNAPDGSVYLLDMYHGIIQHKTYVTSYLREYYINQGLDGPGTGHGRIYRISHKKGKVEKVPNMDTLSNEELVKLLIHPNGWHRDMAQRVLGTREADGATVALLEKLAGMNDYPLGQIHAIWTLEGMGALTAAPIATALNAKDKKVVVSALWAANSLTHPELLKLEKQLLDHKPANDEIKIYLTRALGPIATPAAFAKVNDLVNDSKDKYVKAAAFSGLANRGSAFKAALGDKLKDKELAGWIQKAGQMKGPTGPDLKGKALASFNRGKSLFHGEAACFGCHAPDGAGVLGLGPPLDESEWVTGKEEVFVKILLHGITGPLMVNGIKYETPAEMPALYVNPTFTDEKIADIMTYTRNAWSNKADAVSADLIKKLRKETASQSGRPYTAADLK